MRRAWLSLLVGCLAAAPAAAGVPSPATSTVPCVRASLSEGLQTLVFVRDIAGNPILGSTVVIDLSNCPGFTHCPPHQPTQRPLDYTWDPEARTATLRTWYDGRATFFLAGGGVGPAGSVRVFADGVLLGTSALVSNDQNGDLVLNGVDFALLDAKLGTSDPTGDIDCDGQVTTADTRQIGWWGTVCVSLTTPARGPTWGTLKVIYR